LKNDAGGKVTVSPSHLPTDSVRTVLIIAELAREAD